MKHTNMDYEEKYKQASEHARVEILANPGLRKIWEEIIDFIQWSEDRGITRHDYHQAKRPAVWIAYLEKQKEQKPVEIVNYPSDVIEACMLRYLQSAANRKDDVEIIEDTMAFKKELLDIIKQEKKPVEIHIDNPNVRKFDPDMKVTTSDSSADGKELLYVSNKSYNIGFRDGVASVKPVEWSVRDGIMLGSLINYFEGDDLNCTADDVVNWLKSLRPSWKPSDVCYGAKGDPDPAGVWKPSEEQNGEQNT